MASSTRRKILAVSLSIAAAALIIGAWSSRPRAPRLAVPDLKEVSVLDHCPDLVHGYESPDPAFYTANNAPVMITERRRFFLKVKLQDGREGWVPDRWVIEK